MEFEGKINNHKSTEQFLQSSNYQKLGSRINNTNEKKRQACLSVFFSFVGFSKRSFGGSHSNHRVKRFFLFVGFSNRGFEGS